MEALFLLAFLLVPAGLIALLILVGKVVLRMVNGPKPVDPNAPPALQHSVTSTVVNTILVIVALLGGLSFAFLYMVGGALARL